MTDFITAMLDLMPVDRAAQMRDALAKMTPEERVEAEASAKHFYNAKRNARDRANIEKALRYNQADRLPTGAAAKRRLKQMERDRAKSAS